MRLRWTLLTTLAVGLLVGPLIKDIPGFVVIAIGNYTVQTRLWQVIAMVVILMLLFVLFYHSFARLWSSAGRLRNWTGGRRWTKARQRTIRGMIALSEGHWQKAEKLLTTSVSDSDTQLINYLAAAQAAQAQKANTRRDNYLRQAHLAEPNAEIAIGLTQAQLQLNHGQYEQALATLTHLKKLAPKHDHVLLLLQKLYRQLGDWQRFIELVPLLKKSTSLAAPDLERFQIYAWKNLMIRAAARGGIESLQSQWMKIAKPFQRLPDMLYHYSELLLQHGAHLEAEKVLNVNIRKLKDERLLYLYGKVVTENLDKQLSFVEGLNKSFTGNAIWLLTLGRICRHKSLWGKAKSYFEQSLALKPSAETYQELGFVFEALGETDTAIKFYREGLRVAVDQPVKSREIALTQDDH